MSKTARALYLFCFLLTSSAAVATWIVPTERVTNGVVIRSVPTSHGERLGLLTPGNCLDRIRDVPRWREVRLPNNETEDALSY